MKFSKEIESFIRLYVDDLNSGHAAIFAGAGMSRDAGYVTWPELLRDIANEVGLQVDREHDLISLAQYHVNEKRGKAGIIRRILEEFSHHAQTTENHKLLAQLPVTTYWTTNYDKVIETSLNEALKIVDVKYSKDQLQWIKPKRDAVVYKMHGDVDHPSDAILTKHQYEAYYKTHEGFITLLGSDLISKTFLFIGFSFTDPNLNYVLSRLNIHFGEPSRDHYFFVKRYSRDKDDDDELYRYKLRKQDLFIGDLKRYGIQALIVDDFPEITLVLQEIQLRFRKRTVFISGSAEEYGKWTRDSALSFVHLLSKEIVRNNYNIVTGFGWGIGSAIINGALEAIYESPNRLSEEQLIMRPFPQFASGSKTLPELWENYRQKMISIAGVSIILFGNKKDATGKIVDANGVMREFEIAIQHGLVPIPIAETGFAAAEILEHIMKSPDKFYLGVEWIIPIIKDMSTTDITPDKLIKHILIILEKLNK
jgi:hypothetical protein